MTAPISVVLADDSAEVRSLVRARLRLSKRFEVVGEASTGGEAVDLVTLADRLAALVDAAPEPDIDPPAPPPGAATLVDPVLQEHLERFRAAFDQAAIGMATLTLTGRVVRGNAALEDLVAPPSNLVGAHYGEVADDADGALATAIEEVASGARDVASVEHRLISGPTVLSTLAVVRDSGRQPLYLFLQVQDVSERRAAEEELHRSEERFRLLVESVQDYAIFMLDMNGNIASWNLGAQRAKGYTADEIIGKHFSTFYLPDAVAAGHPQYELEVALAEGRYEEEGWRVRRDGSVFWANVVITAIKDATGRHIGFAKVTRDVTERRAMLESLENAAAERTPARVRGGRGAPDDL